jgi:phosphatidylserine/phosphatidylglycerophosphate/cardiolipin synthase-like enzyme
MHHRHLRLAAFAPSALGQCLACLAAVLSCGAPAMAPVPAKAMVAGPSAGATDAGVANAKGAGDAAARVVSLGVGGSELELVETAPVETSLDHADIRDASDVWVQAFDQAKISLDIAEFYVSNGPSRTGKLEPVLRAIERAVARKVHVRILVDESFYARYPESVERLRSAGAETARLDAKKLWGGVLHAKYFVVDGARAYVGSQNFDYRSLEHIREMGVWVRGTAVPQALAVLFQEDWMRATERSHVATPARAPVAFGAPAAASEEISVALSPQQALGSGTWDLPRLVAVLDAARATIAIELLTYKTTNRDGSTFLTLDEALRRAASRGVAVRLLVSHWAEKEPSLYALARVPQIHVGIVTIPKWSGGDIPFARVSHAKYLVADGNSAWLGTSNWEGDYFSASRNVSLFIRDPSYVRRLRRPGEDAVRTMDRRGLGAAVAEKIATSEPETYRDHTWA